KDNLPNEFALAPDQYNNFLEQNFGFEDRYFLINYSNEKESFPYILPGPVDTWGGTWSTAGWRTHELNILFGSQQKPNEGLYILEIDLVDYAKKFLPLIKIEVNDYSETIQL